jgi:four helix bundle protein
LAKSLPSTPTAKVIGPEILRSGTSVGANYRAACRAKSRPDFIFKLGIVEEEADESIYWMELLVDAEMVRRDKIENLLKEADEILAIVVASIETAKLSRG